MSKVGTESQQKSITAVVNFDRNAIFFSLVYKLTWKIKNRRSGVNRNLEMLLEIRKCWVWDIPKMTTEIPALGRRVGGYTFRS